MVNRERLINSFMEMTAISSVSGQEHEFRDYIRNEFEKRGFIAEEDDAGITSGGTSGNLLLRKSGENDLQPVLLSAHMDTVEPGRNIKAVIENNEVIRSAGGTILGADDKAAIAALLESVDIITENQLVCPPLEILLTVSEEQGLQGAKRFDYSRLNARLGYTLDGGGSPGTIIIKSPCQNEIEYIAYGKAAHAGIQPEQGVNAIKLAAAAMAQMPSGRIDEETTCNFGVISGGQARNIVPDYCSVRGEARSLKREKLDQLTHSLREIFIGSVTAGGGQAEVKVSFLYPEVRLNPDDKVVKLAIKAIENIGLPLELIETGGGSDASIINAHIPCANLGIGMQNVHTTEEYIKIHDLIDDVRLILAILEEYCSL
ncbi:MAG TPA: M20/M25/M40 family metallo-hydrolase [Syntrophomonadaceae bacterium]|nr:M20/M25/M40 family metallo-hydrolase [Syntrophomonadaceae bacterium]HRX20139.1 M20/M25/M40 family metallo-hydrolase [Syntrophomonadaceae bacterium]